MVRVPPPETSFPCAPEVPGQMQVLRSGHRPASDAEAAPNRDTRTGVDPPHDAAPRGNAPPHGDASFLSRMDASHADVCRAERRFFTFIAEADRRCVWTGEGAHDMAHWL